MILKINGINHFENIKEDNNSSIEHEGIDSHLKEDNLSNDNEIFQILIMLVIMIIITIPNFWEILFS